MNLNGGGFAATVLPSERRAGYGAAPPASRVATAIATRRALRPALDPGALYGPSPRSGRRAGAKPLPAQPHGAHDPNPTKQSLYGYRGLPITVRWGQFKPSQPPRRVGEWGQIRPSQRHPATTQVAPLRAPSPWGQLRLSQPLIDLIEHGQHPSPPEPRHLRPWTNRERPAKTG